MDWPKAKAYLVGIFLAVDLLLAYDLVLGQRASLRPAALPASRVLAREGIVLLDDLPASYPRRLAGLRVGAVPADPEETARRVLGAGAVSRGGSASGGTVFEKGKERLIVLRDGIKVYENRALGEASVGPPLDGAGARRAASAFLEARGWRPADAAADLALPLAGGAGYQVTLTRRYGDLWVFPSYVSVLVTAGGVQAAEQEWLVPAGATVETFAVLPPADALRRVRDRIRSGDGGGSAGGMARLVVERLDLGFAGQRPAGADSWVLRPAWRVLTRGGTAFYVYNPDGEVEAAR